MGNPIQFAVLQKDPGGLTVEQVKRAFKAFSHLTDADAVRLAVGARGILMRHLGQDSARALQLALQAEGAGVIIVAERDLPQLPEGLSLHRLEIWPQSLTVYDPLNRPVIVAWEKIAFIAAGASQQPEATKTQTEHAVLRFNAAAGVRPKTAGDSNQKIGSGLQFLLEILLAGGVIRYQVDAAQFSFKHVIDRPGLSLEEQFIWLVREICRHTPRAALNAGALGLQQGQESVPVYVNRQTLNDEMIWLLWQNSRQLRLAQK
jgi:hypothetical protein